MKNFNSYILLLFFCVTLFHNYIIVNGQGQLLNSTERPRRLENDTEGDYEYEDEEGGSSSERPPRSDSESKDKFFSTPSDIVLEHVDFVTLRLRHILNQTVSNLPELLKLQTEEFSLNAIYKEGWAQAKDIYRESTKRYLRAQYPKGSPVFKVPPEYHIALISYSLQFPSPIALYSDFNAKTRDLCSGKDILEYQYKSYFRIMELATEALGGILKPGAGAAHHHRRDRDNETSTSTPTSTSSSTSTAKPIPALNLRFLYRGVGRNFKLEEGQLLAFQHFISTSIDLKVAEMFSGSGTLFEFDGEHKSNFGVFLGSHSYYRDEEEVLLSPLQIFQVDSIHEGSSYKRYVLKSRPIKDPSANENCQHPSTSNSIRLAEDDKSIRTLTTTVAILGGMLGACIVTLLGVAVIAILLYRKGFCGRSNRTISELQLS